MEPGFSSAAERTAPMTCAERRAVAFVHLIAEWHPEPGSPIGLAVTAARRLSVALHVEAGTHIAAPVLPPVAGTVRAASSFPPSLDAAHTIKEPKIGRASCRERVCQYG